MNTKRFLVILALIVVSGIFSGCGSGQTPVPTITPMPTIAPTLTPTATPTLAPTDTPIPTPTPIVSYAIVSVDKVEFWFPIPDRKEWEWNTISQTGSGFTAEYSWNVDAGGYRVDVFCINLMKKPPQKGSFDELLKTCNALVDNRNNPPGFSFSYSNGGLLMQWTEPVLAKKVYEKKSQSFLFTSNIQGEKTEFDVTPVYK